ncbi:MAG: QueT transporter family protein [Bacillota bacterium]
MHKSSIRVITTGAIIAALYFVLAILFAPISFGPIQFRVSEALTILPIFTPAAIPGLFLGCIMANLFGGAGPIDIVFGSLATLGAALVTHRLRGNIFLAILPPIVFNGLIVGYYLSVLFALPMLITMGQVTLGEAGVLVILGVPLYYLLIKVKLPNLLGYQLNLSKPFK